ARGPAGAQGWSAALLVRGADQDQPAPRPGDGAADEQDVAVVVDADDGEVADGAALGPVAAGHALALLGPAAAAVAGVRADAAGSAVVLLDAVAGGQALEVVPLHRPGRSAALGRADHVHGGHVLEDLSDPEHGADLGVGRAIEAELADVALRL